MTDERRASRLEESELVGVLAKAANLSPDEFLAAVKRQITAKRDEITIGDMIALFATAQQYGLNPLRKEVSLIATKQGPRVYVTFDGWLRVLVSHPQYLSHKWEYRWSGGAHGVGTCDAVTFVIRRKCADGSVDVFEHTELMRECAQSGDFTPWNKWPSRMLAQKAAMQATRFCFAMYVPDLDDVLQAETFETGREAAEAAAPSPGAVGPVVPIPAKALPTPTAPITIDVPMLRGGERIVVGRGGDPVHDRAASADEDRLAAMGAPGATDRPNLGGLAPESRVGWPTGAVGAPKTAPATLPGFDIEESRRLDAEMAAREAGSHGDGFDDLDLG